MKQFCTKSKKPYFWVVFGPNLPKIGLRHIFGIAILHLCAKNQQKLMSQSREKLVTDAQTNERTDGQRLIYRTSKVGPKMRGHIPSKKAWFLRYINLKFKFYSSSSNIFAQLNLAVLWHQLSIALNKITARSRACAKSRTGLYKQK